MAELDDTEYDTLQPVQWPINNRAAQGTQRLFADGKFYTPTGKARMVAVTPQRPAVSISGDYPLLLNTGRIRDQWHTMTRTGKVPRLNAHVFEPFVQVHASDAQKFLLTDGGLARLTSRHGSMLARVQVSEDQRAGSVFVPMHWNDAFAKAARVDALVAPITDPISGQPESKHTPVRVEPYQPQWYGFVLSRARLELKDANYCACSQRAEYWRHEIAGEKSPEDSRAWVVAALAEESKQVEPRQHGTQHAGEWIEYRDAAMGRYRAACLRDGQLEAVFFIAADPRLPEREWLGRLFSRTQLEPAELAGLLSARPPKGTAPDCGRNVCACFGVGEKTILNAIQTQGLDSVEAIGLHSKAGTGCGSCVPEIRQILALLLR